MDFIKIKFRKTEKALPDKRLGFVFQDSNNWFADCCFEYPRVNGGHQRSLVQLEPIESH
eukprot:c44342_g1_i1 orf=85-261(+)